MPLRMRSRALAVLVVAALAAPPAASAQEGAPESSPPGTTERQREIEEKIRRLHEAIGEASADEIEMLGRLAETQRDLDAEDAELARIDADLGAANARLAGAEDQVRRLDRRHEALGRRVRLADRGIAMLEGDVAELTVEMYRRAGGAEAAALTALTLDASTPEDLFAGTKYLADAAEASSRRIEELGDLKDEASEARVAIEDDRITAREARDRVASERARIASLHDEQAAARQQVAVVVQRQEDLLAEIRSRKYQFNAEIAALRAESNSIAALLARLQSGQTLATGSGLLILPVAGPITSGFGTRVHPILGTARMHNGIDFGAGHGSPVVASADGTVVWAGARGGYGNTVIIDHGNALATLYGHQSSVAVSVGQAVARGALIGAVGSTGLSTGPHLHFEVRVRGVPADPLGYL